ncbi:winged helix-turn-helix transcriptional regulator [Candidatus Woesebacteria bacterium]|jgi:DNA-binding transcriptional ArsR family regulator|nr:winged helix-turn-helix transcriptional regulator [Candidatus Woesebacteria bacterium]HNV44872.1 winged helix-turn-helix domain-containing protein [Candidatus Woesebacteria bacterium]HOA11970.1 winged helix-turn-helix domain-containing protein [Candidatus Woesebacteria bacterium]HOC07387.1 winged helix-turn-helix domain-containing protein [Candidatus Woesebacteria bacterium]HOI05143.1 winged helix-turn-helix domain-containing protein [Candidatus Woesebacteria bacterium]
MSCLNDLLISKVRVKVLELFYKNPDEMYYVREITRLVKEEINAVRRELERMLDCGLLKSEQRGNRLYYYLNKRYLYHQELQRIVAKSTGLGKKIRRNRRKLGTLSYVMFSGTFTNRQQAKPDELDILVVGDVVLPELEELIRAEQKELGREINYAVLSADEFEFRKTRRDPFVMEVLYGVRVMIIGDENEFCHRDLPIN